MDDDQLNDKLTQLGQATLADELLDVTNLHRRRWTVFTLVFTTLLIIGAGVAYLDRSGPVVDENLKHEPEALVESIPTVRQPGVISQRGGRVTHKSADPELAPHRNYEPALSKIDTSGVLVMHLTREEALAFGIGRHGDGIVTTHQSLVSEDKQGVYDEIQCDTSDTNALFTYTKIVQLGFGDTVTAISCDGYALNEFAAVQAVAIDSVCVLQIKPNAGHNPAIACQELGDSVYTTMHYTCYAEHSFGYGYDVCQPTETSLARDRKPLFVKIESDTPHGRYVVTFMPTESIRKVIPDRFKQVYDHLYGVYKPDKPTKYRHRGKPLSKANLVKMEGPAGQPLLQVDDATLRKLGILRDSAAVCHLRLGGIAVDTNQMTFQTRWLRRGHQFGSATWYSCDSAVLESEREKIAMTRKETHDIFMPLAYLDEITPYDPLPDYGTMYTTMSIGSRQEAEPNTTRLAWRISMALNGMPADSLAYYYLDEEDVRFPIASLFVPLRVQSDGVKIPGHGDTLFYAVRTFLYLPTPGFLRTLPPNIQSFARSEYAGIMAFLEQHLTEQELCSQLEQPSFVNLCPIQAQPYTIESCGPIPAHDHVILKISSEKNQSVNISIRDMNGREVESLPEQQLFTGPNNIQIPISTLGLKSGVYFVMMKNNDGAATTRFLYQE